MNEKKPGRLKEYLPREEVTFKDLAFKKKIEYFWNYYKVHTLVVITIIAVIIGIAFSIVTRDPDPKFNLYIFNQYNTEADSEGFRKELVSLFGYEDAEVKLYQNAFSDTAAESNIFMTTRMSANEFDVVIGDTASTDVLKKGNGCMDLSEFLSADLFEKVQKDCLYWTDEEGNQYPYGLNLSENTILKKYNLEIKEPVLVVAHNTPHQEDSLKFIEFLYK